VKAARLPSQGNLQPILLLGRRFLQHSVCFSHILVVSALERLCATITQTSLRLLPLASLEKSLSHRNQNRVGMRIKLPCLVQRQPIVWKRSSHIPRRSEISERLRQGGMPVAQADLLLVKRVQVLVAGLLQNSVINTRSLADETSQPVNLRMDNLEVMAMTFFRSHGVRVGLTGIRPEFLWPITFHSFQAAPNAKGCPAYLFDENDG